MIPIYIYRLDTVGRDSSVGVYYPNPNLLSVDCRNFKHIKSNMER